MAQKFIIVEGIGEVLLIKNKASRSIKISITGDNVVRLSMPSWLPYQTGVKFVESRKDWVAEHRRPSKLYRDGDLFGKSHRLRIFTTSDDTIKTRISKVEIKITIPADATTESSEVQSAIKKAALRAIKQEGEKLLPQRLAELSQKHNFEYKSVDFKKMKARWGSCTNQKDITLNTFLMTLPWNLIDYVLIHELVHTKVLHHGVQFWEEFDRCLPNAKQYRKNLKAYSPHF